MPLSEEQKAIIAKLEDGLDRPSFKDLRDWPPWSVKILVGPVPLSINERGLVIETLRAAWLPRKEWKAYKRQIELRQYEVAKEIAKRGVPYGQREHFVEALYRKSRKALRQFIRRRRRRKQP